MLIVIVVVVVVVVGDDGHEGADQDYCTRGPLQIRLWIKLIDQENGND
jgi:hypothetical protein